MWKQQTSRNITANSTNSMWQSNWKVKIKFKPKVKLKSKSNQLSGRMLTGSPVLLYLNHNRPQINRAAQLDGRCRFDASHSKTFWRTTKLTSWLVVFQSEKYLLRQNFVQTHRASGRLRMRRGYSLNRAFRQALYEIGILLAQSKLHHQIKIARLRLHSDKYATIAKPRVGLGRDMFRCPKATRAVDFSFLGKETFLFSFLELSWFWTRNLNYCSWTNSKEYLFKLHQFCRLQAKRWRCWIRGRL